jgi:hypothetical protein
MGLIADTLGIAGAGREEGTGGAGTVEGDIGRRKEVNGS